MAQQAFHKRVGNYIFIQSIGRGAFAEVFKGMHQTTHEEVAIKMISRARMRDEEVQIEKEIRILKELKHQNIVNFLDYQKTQNHYYLVFEYCKHGDLEHFIRDNYNGKVPEYAAQKFIQQIVEGIKAMKAKNIVHRDLKLANILVSKDFVLKIADFGLARYLEKEDNLLRTMVGTPLNMDPFILERKGYNEKCDIWSLGVIFYQILVGKPPYNPGRGADIHDLLDLIKKQPLTFPEDIPLSDSFKGLIRRMLVYEPSKRMTFEELFEHEWITGTFKVEDPNKPTENEMDASELLKSQFLDKKMEEKKDKIRDKRLASKQDQSAKGQLQPEKQKIVAPKQDNPIEKIGEKERRNEIFGGVFLAKVYEIFRGRVAKLREYVKRINQMVVPNEVNQDDHVAIVQALMLMELLQLLKEVLNSKFTITEEMSEEVVFENDFKALWDFVISHKDIIENLYSTNDATLEIPDLYSEIKQDYLETFETISNKLESMRDIFERFKGHNSEQLLMDCLIHLSKFLPSIT